MRKVAHNKRRSDTTRKKEMDCLIKLQPSYIAILSLIIGLLRGSFSKRKGEKHEE